MIVLHSGNSETQARFRKSHGTAVEPNINNRNHFQPQSSNHEKKNFEQKIGIMHQKKLLPPQI